MTVFEFTRLAEIEKIEVLYREGSYVGKRKKCGYSMVLYQLEGFYVEILYNKYRTSITSIDCFTSISRLDPYLEQMDIYHLVKHQIK